MDFLSFITRDVTIPYWVLFLGAMVFGSWIVLMYHRYVRER